MPDSHSLIQWGPTISVSVSEYVPKEILIQDKVARTKTVHALIDTGAIDSCIDKNLAEELGLPKVDEVSVAGANGATNQPIYMGIITSPDLDLLNFGRFIGVDLKDGGQQHDVLIGRTFLRHVIMIYDGIRSQVSIASPVLPMLQI